MPRDEPAILAVKHQRRVYRPQGWFSPVVVRDGQVIGVWRHERAGRTLRIAIEPFAPLAESEQALIAAEAARLADRLGGEPALTFGPAAT